MPSTIPTAWHESNTEAIPYPSIKKEEKKCYS